MKKRFFLIFLIYSLFTIHCSLFLTGCKQKESKAVAEKTFNVQVKSVETKSFRPFIEATGTLNPNEEIFISAEIEGILRSVNVDEGTIVSKGMLLAAINDMDYVNEVKRDEAALKQTEATLANTKLEFTRKDALYKEELVTQQQFDDVTTRLALAEAERERGSALLSIAKQKLTKTKIYAPLPCVVKEKKVSIGDFVRVGTQIFILIQSNPIKLQFAVPEKDVGKLKTGQDALLKVDAFPGKEFRGKVSIIYPSLEEKTRTLLVEALVPNPGNALKPGLFVKVMLYTGAERDTVVIPITSLLYEADKIKVFVVEGDRAKQRLIKVGSKYGELMEVVEGVKEGEKVVIAGQQNLSEGVKVKIQPAGIKN